MGLHVDGLRVVGLRVGFDVVSLTASFDIVGKSVVGEHVKEKVNAQIRL